MWNFIINIFKNISIQPKEEPKKNEKKLKYKKFFYSKKQKLCNDILEEYYNKHFFSVRPNWLKNYETGYNLELDCYNDELKVALEYNGEQHYE